MADVSSRLLSEAGVRAREQSALPDSAPNPADAARTNAAEAASVTDAQLITFVELLFFAYRDFTREADAMLAQYRLGRAHHRVLHFVNRHPGLRVADLLDILKITKQSLARVLKQLLDEGWIQQRCGERDRRQRLLFVTEKGARLAARLDGVQARRVAQAIALAGAAQQRAIARFLFAMIAPEERLGVDALLPVRARADRP